MTDEEKIADYIIIADSSRKSAEALINKYGHGVRPSWVSTDLEIDYRRAREYTQLAEKLGLGLAIKRLEASRDELLNRDKGIF
jgi:hypothetical protein